MLQPYEKKYIDDMSIMNRHDLYNYLVSDIDVLCWVASNSIGLLYLTEPYKTPLNDNLDAVMSEILFQEHDAYKLKNIPYEEYKKLIRDMSEEDYNFIAVLRAYFERCKAHPALWTFKYKTQQVKKCYDEFVEVLVGYREYHRFLRDQAKQLAVDIEKGDAIVVEDKFRGKKKPDIPCNYDAPEVIGRSGRNYRYKDVIDDMIPEDFISVRMKNNKGWTEFYDPKKAKDMIKRYNLSSKRRGLAKEPE